MSRSARFTCAALGALAAACAGAPETNATDRLGQAVSGGEISGPEDDFVVSIIGRQPKPYDDDACTGTLLAPNLIVTALHCVAVFDGMAPFSCLSDGSLAPSSTGGWIGETLPPEHIEVYFGNTVPLTLAAHGALVLGTGSALVCVDDVAFVVLDTALPLAGVAVRNERPVVTGERMTIIGYGANDFVDLPRARRSGVPVLGVGPDDTSGGVRSVAPRTFVVGDGPCRDFGAPALSDETGAVTGVFAFDFFGDCTVPGTRGSFMQLSPYAALVRRAFDAAGAMPKLETPLQSSASPRSEGSCSFDAGEGDPASAASVCSALGVLLARRRRANVRTTRRS